MPRCALFWRNQKSKHVFMKNICCKPTLAFWFAIIVAILTALSSQSQTTFKSEIKGKGTPMILIPGLT